MQSEAWRMMMKFFITLLIGLILCCETAYAKMDFAAQINVDVTAEDAVQAKEQAMLQAQREAF